MKPNKKFLFSSLILSQSFTLVILIPSLAFATGVTPLRKPELPPKPAFLRKPVSPKKAFRQFMDQGKRDEAATLAHEMIQDHNRSAVRYKKVFQKIPRSPNENPTHDSRGFTAQSAADRSYAHRAEAKNWEVMKAQAQAAGGKVIPGASFRQKGQWDQLMDQKKFNEAEDYALSKKSDHAEDAKTGYEAFWNVKQGQNEDDTHDERPFVSGKAAEQSYQNEMKVKKWDGKAAESRQAGQAQ